MEQAAAGRVAPLTVVACVTEGLDPAGPFPLGDRRGPGGPAPVPGDLVVVEAAVRLTERYGGRVALVAVGPVGPGTWRAYRGLGADESLEIEPGSARPLDPFQVAWLLARAVRPLAPDLLLCGERAVGREGSGLVPFALAELLELPIVPGAVALEVQARALRAERLVERGDREILEAPRPAVVTVARAYGPPRYPALAKARRTAHRAGTLADLGVTGAELEARAVGPRERGRAAARPRPRKLYVPPGTLPAADRLAALMAGGRPTAPRRDAAARYLEGPPAEVAGRMIEFLRSERILGR